MPFLGTKTYLRRRVGSGRGRGEEGRIVGEGEGGVRREGRGRGRGEEGRVVGEGGVRRGGSWEREK